MADKQAVFRKRKRDFLDIKPGTNFLFNIICILFSLMAIVPFIFVVIISFTSQASLVKYGYQFIPHEWSLEGYEYILKAGKAIFTSYGISIIVTLVGTLLGLVLISTYAYVLSRTTYPYRKFFTVVALIPMLFSGGMVANFMLVSSILGLMDNIWALILPLAVSPFYIFVMKSFYLTTVPDGIIESARIDGASELRTFTSIVLPISKPGLATVGLFLTLGYWNDWFNTALYINSQTLYPIQYFLMSIQNNIQALKSMSGQIPAELLRDIPNESVQMAIAVLVVVPIACAYPFFQRYFTGGLTLGAIKG